MHSSLKASLDWYVKATKEDPKSICPTRDVFQARLDTFFDELMKFSIPTEEAALLTSVMGEIGNNSFDHNLGLWKSTVGCWFQHFIEDDMIMLWIADRGQGFLSSLGKVDPTLTSAQKAIEVAYEKKISGRAPEKRGNGLKFVRNVINAHPLRGCIAFSGGGVLSFGGNQSRISKFLSLASNYRAEGVFTLIFWGKA